MGLQLALSVTGADSAARLLENREDVLSACDAPPDLPLTRLQFGSEFCENLLPSPAQLRRLLALVGANGLFFSLATPVCSDRALARIRRLLRLLPPGTEVIANDWGLLRILKAEFSALVPVAGRMICKQVKDPRLPSAQWSTLYPHGLQSDAFTAVLKRFNIARVEMDVAPHAEAGTLRIPSLGVSVHAPWGFTVRGRACRIGSLHLRDGKKFAIAAKCRRECLGYEAAMTRPRAAAGEPQTLQRGNAIFYRHTPDMAATLNAALAAGHVDRVVLAGDFP